jgi:hypothetical protein
MEAVIRLVTRYTRLTELVSGFVLFRVISGNMWVHARGRVNSVLPMHYCHDGGGFRVLGAFRA